MLDRLAMWIFGPLQREWQVLCTNLYLGHPCGAIVDPLGILACFLLTPSLVFIHRFLP